jgi:hypothetical protein
MPDETPESAKKPRPEKQRAPVKPRQMKKLSRREADELEYSTCLVTADQQVCIHIATNYSPEHAALTMGWTLDQVHDTLRLPECRNFMLKQQQTNMDAIARSKIRLLTKVDISPAAVEERLMELAMLDPEKTRGTIDGQVKALRTLAEVLGMMSNSDDGLKRMGRTDLEGIVKNFKAKAGMLPEPLQDAPAAEY